MSHSTERFTDYDPFAWIYDSRWGEDYYSQIMAVLDQILTPFVPSGGTILDIGCGTGHVTQQLAVRGYRTIGIESSAEMLRYAHQKMPDAEFHLADARWFTLPVKADAAISTFDALNHIMEPRELALVCQRVRDCLAPGGPFVFDLNREEAYRSFWSQSDAKVEPDRVCVARGGYQPTLRVATCDITLFRDEHGQWHRSDFTMRQRCHSEEEVKDALRQGGFTHWELRDAAQDLGMTGNIGQGRTYYVAR